MKFAKRIIVWLTAVVCAFSAFGCKKPPEPTPEPKPENPVKESKSVVTSDYTAIEGLEKDYVYMWYPNGLNDKEKPYLNFQAPSYGLSFNTSTGMIEGMGVIEKDGEFFEEMDASELPFLPTMYYDVETAGGHIRTDGTAKPSEDTQRLWARAIESGRNMQRADVISLNYEGIDGTLIAKNFLGRIEIAANREYFSLNYGVYNSGNVSLNNVTLSFSINLGTAYTNVTKISDKKISALDTSGKGFTFVIPDTSVGSATMNVNGTVVTFTKSGVTLPVSVLDYTGFGVVVVPTSANCSADSVIAQENFISSAVQVQPTAGKAQDISYDANRGVFVVNTDNMMSLCEPFLESRLDSYEKLTFKIKNTGSDDAVVPVAFKKTVGTSFNAMGFVPMIRKTNGDQTGITVQISKNWHSYDNGDTAKYPKGHYKRYLEGKWAMCYAMLEIPAGAEIEYEYLVEYAKWGGVYGVSHSQLCLIGYASDWIWDQSCMGSWGESICFDPDRCLGRALIGDVRPFGMTTAAGAYNKYNWTDNIGGADFLWYYSLDKESQLEEGRIINQKVNYRAQGPNMSDVVYSGTTADGKINTFINIRMGRTDDVTRAYYTLTYEIAEDLNFTSMALFKLGAEKYADTGFRKFAVGNENEVLRDDLFILEDRVSQEFTGKNPWFMLYDSERPTNPANKMLTVREFNATINGAQYTAPDYRLAKTNNGGVQPSFELSVPAAAGNTLKAGTRIDMVVEMTVLPNTTADKRTSYYLESDYMQASKALFNTASAAVQQAKGNGISISSLAVGTLRGKYPVEIDSVQSSEAGAVVAQFALTGGLGYTPVVFNKLTSAAGYELQCKSDGGEWIPIVQSGSKGETKDFYQVRRLYDGTYQWVFNVKNTTGLNFGTTSEYRLVKTA